MSNRNNPRSVDRRRTEHGPHYENHDRADPPHVARARKAWKRIKNRTERRTGEVSKYHPMKPGRNRPRPTE